MVASHYIIGKIVTNKNNRPKIDLLKDGSMNFITALLAFSVTMLMLSTAVTAFVQILHRVRRVRERHLRHFLSDYFDKAIWSRFSIQIMAAQATAANDDDAKSDKQFSWLEQLLWRLYDGLIQAGDWVLNWRGCRFTIGVTVILAMLGGVLAILVFDVLDPKSQDLLVMIKSVLSANWVALLLIVTAFACVGLVIGLADHAFALTALSVVLALIAILLLSIVFPAATELVAGIVVVFGLGLISRFRETRDGNDDRARLRKAFVDEMTSAVGTVHQKGSSAKHLDPVDFAARLAATPVGKAILAHGEDKLDLLVTDLVRKFDSLGDGATESFRELSQRWSIRIAFVLAIVANVDAVHLLRQYINDPELSARVEKLGDEAAKLHTEMTAKLVALQKKQQEKAPNDQIEAAKKAYEDAKTVYEKTQSTLSEAGVPIGPAYYPFCKGAEASKKDGRCKKIDDLSNSCKSADPREADKRCPKFKENVTHQNLPKCEALQPEAICRAASYWNIATKWLEERWITDSGDLFGWLFGTVLAGALIGLGGPFWFDIYRQISSVAQVTRGFGLGRKSKTEEEQKEAAEVEKPADKKHAAASAVEAFRDAAKANQTLSEGLVSSRQLLASDGTPLGKN